MTPKHIHFAFVCLTPGRVLLNDFHALGCFNNDDNDGRYDSLCVDVS